MAALVPLVAGAGADVSPGWERSYQAGVLDCHGRYLGGSEIMHIVSHRGRLFASNGYWEDGRNIWYGGKDPDAGWGQVLRLDKPGGPWEVDLEMGPQHLRAETLASITFTTDGTGRAFPAPVNLLVAGAYTPQRKVIAIDVFTRDDDSGTWAKNPVYSGPKPADTEDCSVRAVCVHRDKVTGIDRVFLSIGKLGIFSGVYDPCVAGKIRWCATSESGPVETRPLAIVNAGGDLLFSAGRKIYRRNDGASPTYTMVQDMSDLYPDAASQPVGGIRGLSAIPNPAGKGESLLFAMAEGKRSRGAIYRLDPTPDGRYTRVREVYLDDLMSRYLNGNPVYFILAAYNDFYPIVDPSTKDTVHLIGFEAWIGGHRFPLCLANKEGGFYAGGMYAIRDKNGTYRLREIGGRSPSSKSPLVATRVFASSPFQEQAEGAIYFGGYDGNHYPANNTAWIFSTSLENALRPEMIKPDESKQNEHR